MTEQTKNRVNEWVKIGITAIIIPIIAYFGAILIQIQKDIIELKIEVKSYQVQINELRQDVKEVKRWQLEMEHNQLR
jgi:cell division protein FtsL